MVDNKGDDKSIDIDLQEITLLVERECILGQEKTRSKDYGLMLVLAGSAKCIENGRQVLVTQNDLLLFPDTCSYQIKSTEAIWFFIVNFRAQGMEGICSGNIRKISTNLREQFFQYYSNLERVWRERQTGYRIEAKSLLYTIFHRLILEQARLDLESRGYHGIQHVIEYIHRNYATPLCIDDLADLGGYSQVHFRRVFKSLTGTAPVEYIRRIRISHAKSLLVSRLFSIQEIAEKTGFSQAAFFSRVFKKLEGIPPGEYRKRYS